MPSTNRDGLPSKGAVIVAAAPKIKHSAGGPLRMLVSGESA
jgi:kynurenine formamidase